MRRSDTNPKVFISHASEDKERFLRAFVTKLRQEAGVDAWPGLTSVDTLVLKLPCQKAIAGFDYFIQTHDVWEQVDAVGVPLVEFNDSLEVLHGRGLHQDG